MYALQPKMKNRSSRSITWRSARTDGSSLGGFCSVHVRLLLSLHDVLLVADPLVPEPVAHLEVGPGMSIFEMAFCLGAVDNWDTCHICMQHMSLGTSLLTLLTENIHIGR